ncbi:MAG: hypothetical protein CMM60_07300 [Rhodospirillaceae bacterium]|nr:hypothetical protein [Rhodospirillaceae bacterium]
MTGSEKQPLRVGIGGMGTVGWPVAKWLDGEGARGGDGAAEGLVLAAVSAADKERAGDRVSEFNTAVPVVGLAELADVSDVIVETAPPERFAEVGVVKDGAEVACAAMQQTLMRIVGRAGVSR